MMKPIRWFRRRAQLVLVTLVFSMVLSPSGCRSSRTAANDIKAEPKQPSATRSSSQHVETPKLGADKPPPTDSIPPTEDVAQSQASRRFAEEKHREAQALFRDGRYDAANAKLEEAIARDPMHAGVHLLRGKIYLMQGSANQEPTLLKNALMMFELAYSIDSSLTEAEELRQLLVNDILLQEQAQ